MTDGATSNSAPGKRPLSSSARIDEVFGEVLPRTTSDEARDRDARLGDDWWMEQRPPHHG
ncbi:hypothetical protein G6027_12045 [Dietzia sp. SLG310A2-38A2]|uniref:hypothetical protein n=1 Tax=Dietzia sp. SLG310A2-38A2 TaxID=1630643 RepID=UPI0015FAAD92|nr:hypothetical protein [Dietzia sp. SLG310A2-38A2]MBB1031606.1 hypothetical protein [Dietzia sp. SLG310A2-38A2]